VDGAVMAPTEHREIRERGGPALRPVANVVALPERHVAAGKATAAVAVVQRPSQGRRNRPCPRADFDSAAVRIVSHHHPACVARQPPRRFCGDVGAALEHGLAGCLRIREHGHVDVDDDLVSLTRSAGIEALVESALGQQRQRVRLLLLHRGRFCGNVPWNAAGVHAPRPLIQRLPCRGQRLHQHGACVGCEPPADDDHTVFILIHVHGAAFVQASGLARLGQHVDTAPAANDPLDVARGARPAHCEQPLLGLGRGHAGQRPHLGVGELPTSKSIGQSGQCAEGARDPHTLAGRTHVDPDPPGKPMRA
jgi:hypothetical protein